MNLIRKLGLNYAWGIGNFAAGVTIGGIWVAVLMTLPKLINLARAFL